MFKKNLIKSALTIICVLYAITILNIAFAAYGIPQEYKPNNAVLNIDPLQDTAQSTNLILQTIAGALLYFAAPVAIISIGMAAFTITIYGNEPDKLGNGKKHLIWTIIGLIIIMLSYSAVRIVIDFTLQAGTPPKTEQPAGTPPSTP
ncbi:MAG: hypothetical protein WC806_03225 [Candidatus Gracilibacteria bacterium]|jgi:flagellar basal body-associated protein FliL